MYKTISLWNWAVWSSVVQVLIKFPGTILLKIVTDIAEGNGNMTWFVTETR